VDTDYLLLKRVAASGEQVTSKSASKEDLD